MDARMLAYFLESPLYRRMCQSRRVERELAFAQELPAAALFDADADERVMLQGVIDCCMLEDGEWTLLDYKTDRVPRGGTPEETAARHRAQVELYAGALGALSGIPVREKYVVLLRAGACIRL